MSRRRIWFGSLIVLGSALLLLPFTSWLAPEDDAPPAPLATADREQEKRLKADAVRKDMDATALLCTLECAKEFGRLAEIPASRADGELKRMLHMHPHMAYVDIRRADGSAAAGGAIPAGVRAKAEQLLGEARSAVRTRDTYVSKPFMNDGHRYIVLAVPGPGDGSVAGIIRQDIVDQVERHQRRNLRLVPYPAEGRYRIESAVPNTTRDTTVRTGDDNGNASHYHTRQVVVRFRSDPSEAELNRIMKAIDGQSAERLGYTYIFTSRSMEAEQMIRYFAESVNPVYVEPHYLYLTNSSYPGDDAAQDADGLEPIVPNDLLYARYQWNLPSIETEKGWRLTKGSEGVTVAVLDTGVQLDHPDLQGKLAEGVNVLDDAAEPDDDVGHGTHVAGVISAGVNNGEGVAGMSWYNKVMPVKVLDSSGAGSTYSVAEGIIWATDHGAKVINMSLGNYASAEFLHDAIKYAYDNDVVLIAASGNDNTERPGFPAAYPEVFAVAATDASGMKAPFSNYGDYIDVAAPGDNIPSTYPGNQYAALSGTSMASPHVAALAALIRSINPALSNEEVMAIMRSTATDLGEAGRDIYYGYGQIDVVQALQAAERSVYSLDRFADRFKRRLESIVRSYE